jgi:hypothetical protein
VKHRSVQEWVARALFGAFLGAAWVVGMHLLADDARSVTEDIVFGFAVAVLGALLTSPMRFLGLRETPADDGDED